MNHWVCFLRCGAEPALVELGDVVMALRVREKVFDLVGDLRRVGRRCGHGVQCADS
jgi:hypothetical protein